MQSLEEDKPFNYNDEPVYYCKHCLSLRIINIAHIDTPVCDKCGSTNIGQCNIKEWEELYKKAHHGMSYLDSNY